MSIVRRLLRPAEIILISMLALSTGALPAAAQTDQVLVGASGMQGIDLQTWATGDVDPWDSGFIEPIEEGQRLRLSRLHFDPCTGIVLHNTGGSVLLYAESSDVDYFFQGGEGSPFTTLHQGDSVAAGPVDYLTIVNGMVDSAYSVDLLVLSVVTGDSFVEVPVLDRVDFPDDSGCNGVNPNGEVRPTILGEGIAADGGETLYLGSAVFLPDSYNRGLGPDQRGQLVQSTDPGRGYECGRSEQRAGGVDRAGRRQQHLLQRGPDPQLPLRK